MEMQFAQRGLSVRRSIAEKAVQHRKRHEEAYRANNAALIERFGAGECDEVLRGLPHPCGLNGSALDYAVFCVKNGWLGNRVYRLIESALG